MTFTIKIIVDSEEIHFHYMFSFHIKAIEQVCNFFGQGSCNNCCEKNKII